MEFRLRINRKPV